MELHHIHISSRFSRSQANLENALDVFRTKASVITMTEVGESNRKRAIAEKGWGWFSGSGGAGTDECSTSWDLDIWVKVYSRAIKLIGRWPTHSGGGQNGTRWPVYANSVILKNKKTGHKILFSTIHAPNKIGGAQGFRPQGLRGAERIRMYKDMVKNWDDHITQVSRNQKVDAIVISADWNINFRNGWVRTYLVSSFKNLSMKQGWKHFTGAGTYGRGIIDGSLYTPGLKTTRGSFVIPDPDNSSDHNPFKTIYETTKKAGTPVKAPASGPTSPGDPDPDPPTTGTGAGYGVEWWNFDDFGDDTIYEVVQT